jgi:hypothetical protein
LQLALECPSLLAGEIVASHGHYHTRDKTQLLCRFSARAALG